MQIHKRKYTNTVNDEMSVNIMKYYIFEKFLMHGYAYYIQVSLN